MQPLNITQVRAAVDKKPPFVEVEISEWGGSIKLRRLRASQYLDLQAQLNTLQGKGGGRKPKKGEAEIKLEGGAKIEEFYVQLVGLCAVDAGGKRLFEKLADLEHLRDSAGVLMKLGAAAMELNGFTAEEPEKNSETTPAEGSPSASA